MYVSDFTPDEFSTQVQSLKYPSVLSWGKSRTISNIIKENDMKAILGGKGANLGLMAEYGLNVPPGFTITTEVCAAFQDSSKLTKDTWNSIQVALKNLEQDMGRRFGDKKKPLLLSVRSGAAISMPGMMDTVLNLGINDENLDGLIHQFGERVALDTYRRLLQMFGEVVLGIPYDAFEGQLAKIKADSNVQSDNELSVENLRLLIIKYKDAYTKNGRSFPQDPMEQLYMAIVAVFNSWGSERCVTYRQVEKITNIFGTAVNIQAMVFGNTGSSSGTGVCFTRDPNTGERALYGEYLINAQGEDVVAGIRTPEPIARLREELPEAYNQLLENVELLEKKFKNMQDIEFTIEDKKLYMLQTRSGKRSGTAAVNIALDLYDEGLISDDEAVMMVNDMHLKQLLHPFFADTDSDEYKDSVIANGLAASAGAAVGRIVFTPEAAAAAFAEKRKCILVREDTSPEDVAGMNAAEGILTATGGFTSHAAVVARGWGKPCICGCPDLEIDAENEKLIVKSPKGDIVLGTNDWISINGNSGEVLLGQKRWKPANFAESKSIARFMEIVDKKRKMKVYANADTGVDAKEARENGAEGIGLVRTEHMFFSEDRIQQVRRFILAKDPDARQKALDALLILQRADFEDIFEAFDGLPVTVRLLDPPLHEFLPKVSEELKLPVSVSEFPVTQVIGSASVSTADEAFAKSMGMTLSEVNAAIQRLQEVNPMLGFRGCRLGIAFPELVEMQARAVVEAVLNNKLKKNKNPVCKIMIPLVGNAVEFKNQADLIRSVISKVTKEYKAKDSDANILVGTMMEVPRACLTADELVTAGAEFFSYGTNDLTQMTFGISRDDVGNFLPSYLKKGIFKVDPFQVIDSAVEKLIYTSGKLGKDTASKLNMKNFEVSVCGEHGGNAESVNAFAKLGLVDYVSCSPYRVPIARLSAAQAEIEMKMKQNKK